MLVRYENGINHEITGRNQMKVINLVFLILLISAFLIIGFVTHWRFLYVPGSPNQIPFWLAETAILIAIVANSISIYKSLLQKTNSNDDPKPQPIENNTANANNGGTASIGDNTTIIHYNAPVTINHTPNINIDATPDHSSNDSSLPPPSLPITSSIAPHGMPHNQVTLYSGDTPQYDTTLKQQNEPKLGDININPKDGAKMVYVPAGPFTMGADSEDDIFLHTEELPAYWVYQTPVTVAQYRAYCQATGRHMPPMPKWGWQDTHPIVNVTWQKATEYAAWTGATLPTEKEWEKAARGTDGRLYPWGNEWDADKCVNSMNSDNTSAPVGSKPAGASPCGALDMAGNVWEWCADWYDHNMHERLLRGGSWNDNSYWEFRASSRPVFGPTDGDGSYGFRCVVHPPEP